MLQGSNQCGRDGLIAILRHNFVTTVCGQQCCNRRREMRMLGNLGKQIGCYKAGREQQRSRRARQGRQRQLERALRGEAETDNSSGRLSDIETTVSSTSSNCNVHGSMHLQDGPSPTTSGAKASRSLTEAQPQITTTTCQTPSTRGRDTGRGQ